MGLIQIEAELEPYCVNCLQMELESHHSHKYNDLRVIHECTYRGICENAIWQHEKLKAKDKHYKHESVKAFENGESK